MGLEPISLSDAVRKAAREHPDVPFMADAPWRPGRREVANRRELDELVDEVADRLWAAGVRPGQHVAVVKRDHVDIKAIAAGAMRMGAVPALLSWRMAPAELEQVVGRLERPVVVVDADAATRFAEVRDGLRRAAASVLGLDDDGPDWVEPMLEREQHEPYERAPDEITIVVHTSGTTGVPKLVAHSVETLYAHGAPTIPIGRQLNDHAFSLKCVSWTHIRTTSATIVVLELGVPMIAATDARPEHIKQLLLHYRPSAVEAHPNLLLRWEPLAEDPDRPLASVRRYLTTFDAMHPRTVRALLGASEQPIAMHMQGYGQSETGPIALRFLTRESADAVAGRSVGTPIDGYSAARVVGDDGEPLPPGTLGRIEARTPGLMLGYVGTDVRPEPGSWWAMGDLGRMHEDGSLELLDRVVDHAERFDSLLELEDALLDALPELDEVVFVKPTEDEVVAVVCMRDSRPFDRAGWDAVASQLGISDVPVQEWRVEDLPFTGSWKVRRHLLSKMVREGTGREAVAG